MNLKHGLAKTPIHRIWTDMRQRCSNPRHHAYKNYGGRGVKVCERWNVFENFLADIGANRPSRKYSLDRIDNNGPYSPENCRWASRTEQANNTTKSRFLEWNGQRKTVSEWCRLIGIKQSTLNARLNYYGWSVEKSLTVGVGRG